MNREQLVLWERPVLPTDIVYTPEYVCRQIIRHLNIEKGILLDQCKGDGAFFNNFSEDCDNLYCEIREGRDFFDFRDRVDWIIGNPPYSIFLEFLEHSFNIADNVSFLVPTNKIFQRQIIMDMINNYGGIKSQIIFGSGTLIGFPFGFSVGNFHFKKDYKGPCELIMGINKISSL